MKLYFKLSIVICLMRMLTLFNSDFLSAMSSSKHRGKVPAVVVDFFRFQQSRYQENELAQMMRQYRQNKEAIQKGMPPSIEYTPTLSFKVPVLVGKFSDSGSDQWKISELEKEMFKGPWTTGTMKAYYKEISYNQFDLDGNVYGWYAAANKGEYYGNKVYGLPKQGGRTPTFIRELIAAADASVDFSQYDNDGDGYVETIFIVHYGQGAEGYNDPTLHTNDIWSHQSKLSYWTKQGGAYKTNDKTSTNKDVYIDSYVIQPAISSDGSSMIEIGVFCHEFGHALGLPDLYDYDGTSEGIGHWGLMGSGGWNKPGSPAHMSAWSKIELGWVTPVLVTHDQIGATILNVEQNPAVHKLWTYGSYTGKQYFLIENRQKVGFDKHLHNSGILIWHVDDSKEDNDSESHKMVDLEEADGSNDLDNAKYGNRGDDGDSFPGSTNNKSFDNSSNPNSRNYNGNNTHCEVKNISSSTIMMNADLIVGTPELKVDLVIKDGPNDNGNEPSPCDPWWTDSEIWIDNNSDGKADLPAKGMDNLLWARIFNFGTEDAANVKVKFYESYPALGLLFPSKAKLIKEATISLIKKNQGSDKTSVKWKIPQPPPKIDHYCIGVIAENDKDKPTQEKARYENNLAQINYIYLVKKTGQVVPAEILASPSSLGFESIFIIYNPKNELWNYHICIDQNSLKLPPGWTASVDPEYVTLAPDERKEGLLTVAVRQVQHGDSGFVSVVLEDEEYHTIEGGINFALIVDDVPPVSPEGLNAHSYFDRRNIITPNDPTVRLNWLWLPEDVHGRPEEIVYYKIYRSTQPSFQLSQANLVDSTAIDEEPNEPGFQWYDTVDISSGPYYYVLTAVDAAGNESTPGNISSIQVPLYGDVRYDLIDLSRPVPEVEVLLDGTQSQLTNPDGFYEFFNVSAGPHKLEVFKVDDIRNAIDDGDAPLLLHYLAFLLELNEFQQMAADVTQNGVLTGTDALGLLRFMNNFSTFIGETGKWRFEPPEMNFDLVIEKTVCFTAFVLGDVNSSWGSSPMSNRNPLSKGISAQFKNDSATIQQETSMDFKMWNKLKLLQHKATIALPADLSFESGMMVELPILVSTNFSVGLAQFLVEYDSTVLEFIEALPAPETSGFNISAVNRALPFPPSSMGTNENVLVQLIGGGQHYFTGNDRQVCFILLKVIGTGDQTSPLVFDRNPNHTFLSTEQLEDLGGSDLDFIDGSFKVTGVKDEVNPNQPRVFALHQNYPNPFNSETKILFDVKERCPVILTIYDLMGRKIKTLVDKQFSPGFYQISLDATGLSSGIYFYQIQMGDFQAMRKMILIE